MADITVLFQQTLKSPSSTVPSLAMEPLRALADSTIGVGTAGAGAGAAFAANELKKLICQGNLSNNDLFNNPELNCSIALGAASLVCGGTAPGILPGGSDVLSCITPQSVIANVTNTGNDCSVDFECGCADLDENSPLNTDGFDPQVVADGVGACQLRAAKDHLKKVMETLDYFNIKDAAVGSTVGNIFAGVTLKTLFEQINYTIENSGSINDINNTLNQQVFNTSYFMSPAFRIVQLLNNNNPGSGTVFANAWGQLSDLYNSRLYDIQSTCALTANVTANDVTSFLNAISPSKKKTCSPTFVLNEDTCDCECPPDHYPCVYNGGIIDAISRIDLRYTRCVPCPSPKVFNSDTCECECPSNKVEKNGACLDPCPEGTVLREVPCSEDHTQVVLNDDGETLSTTCYDCFCRQNLGATGVVLWPLLPDSLKHVRALDCEGEGQVRTTENACECGCNFEAGYVRVFPPTPNYISDPLRCRLPCPSPNNTLDIIKVYNWDRDDCVCPNRLELVPAGAGNDTFERLKAPEEMCGEAEGSFGKVWDDESCSCVCPEGVSLYDPATGICACPSGLVPDQETMSCICPSGTEFVDDECVPLCAEGAVRNDSGECENICPSGTIYIDGLCLPVDDSGSGSGNPPPSGSGENPPPSGSGENPPPSGSGENICPSGTIYIDGLCLPVGHSGSGSGENPPPSGSGNPPPSGSGNPPPSGSGENVCPSGTIHIDGLCLPVGHSGSGSGENPPPSGSGNPPPSGSGGIDIN